MKIILLSFFIFLFSISTALSENWLQDYGYYENSNEISAKDKFIGDVKNIYDFESSPNPGGEKIEKGRYYVPIKYKGGYNGTDTDYIYVDELKGNNGKEGSAGINGKDGKDGKRGQKGDRGDKGERGADGISADNSAIDSKLHDIMETKYIIRGKVRIYDTRRFSIGAFADYDIRHSRGNTIGAEFTYKIGSSYEERKIKNLEQKIQELQEMIGIRATFVENLNATKN